MYFLGLTSLAMQMKNETFALVFWIIALVGATGGFFIHALICIFPLLYKKMIKDRPFEEVEAVLNAGYNAAKIPFFAQFILLVIVSSILLASAIAMGYLSLPVWTIAITPLCLMIVGALLRAIKRSWFYDLPGIIMPSLGLGMMGLLAAMNAAL